MDCLADQVEYLPSQECSRKGAQTAFNSNHLKFHHEAVVTQQGISEC